MRVPFVGSFYEDSTRGFDFQRCINWYPVQSDSQESKSQLHLSGTPGKRSVTALTPNDGTGARGLYPTSTGRLFGVWGDTLYEFDSDGVATDRNSSLRFARLTGNVSMVDGEDASLNPIMVIVDEGKGYVYDLDANTLTEITDASYPTTANQVIWHDGYFVVTVPDTKYFYWSDDGSSWGTTAIASQGRARIISAPDNITGLTRTNTDIWLFGENSMEPWQTQAIGSAVFERVGSATQDVGTKNPWSIAKIRDRIYFLASNKDGYGTVYRVNGYGVEEVSTDAINDKINEVGLSTDATAFTYQEKGHYFYVLSIPSLEKTFSFDETTGRWHERGFWDTGAAQFTRDKSTYHAFIFGKNYVSYYSDNNLYRLDPDYYYDNTDYIRRVRTGAHLSFENKRIRFDKFELEFERGQGADGSGQGSDPKVMRRYSDDGGYTWSTETTRGIGKKGQYQKRARWLSQGVSRDRIEEISISDPVKCDLIDAYAEIEVLG